MSNSAASAAPPGPSARQSAIRTALAGLIGNVLEWFDFAVFGYFSKAIGAAFFPESSPDAQQLKAFAVFALGFGARWLGALVLGRVGDLIGRRALLTLSIGLMGGATLVLGLLPGYATIGVAAPILLVVMRMIQGFSLGGEFTGSMVYTTELASPLMRGLVSSSTAAGTTLGFILGSAASWAIGVTLGEDSTWGWRIPFVASILFCIAGWLLRRGIHESEEGETSAKTRAPIWTMFRAWRSMLQTFGIAAMTNAVYYLAFTFAPETRKAVPGTNPATFQLINTAVLFAVLFSKPLGGWLSDRVGRRRLMIALTLSGMAAIYIAFPLMLGGTPGQFLLGQLLVVLPVGMALGLQGAMLVEIYPLDARVTAMSFAYSVTLSLSGGIAPYVAKWLIDVKHLPQAPIYMTLVYGVLALVTLVPMRETNERTLNDAALPSAKLHS